MTNSIRGMTLAVTWSCGRSLGREFRRPGVRGRPDSGGDAEQDLRVTRAKDVEIQKIEPFKVFDNLYYVGPCYVSVWLLTTPQGHILFDSAQEPFVDDVIENIEKTGNNPRHQVHHPQPRHLDHVGGAAIRRVPARASSRGRKTGR